MNWNLGAGLTKTASDLDLHCCDSCVSTIVSSPKVVGSGIAQQSNGLRQTWNPVTGCDRVSTGCDHCYAMTLANFGRGTLGVPA